MRSRGGDRVDSGLYRAPLGRGRLPRGGRPGGGRIGIAHVGCSGLGPQLPGKPPEAAGVRGPAQHFGMGAGTQVHMSWADVVQGTCHLFFRINFFGYIVGSFIIVASSFIILLLMDDHPDVIQDNGFTRSMIFKSQSGQGLLIMIY